MENLFLAWREFRRGKRKKPDVQEFEFHLEDNLFGLHEALAGGTYEHAPYESFYIQDPKLRHIHKASVRDRVLHQVVSRVLYPIFDKSFIFDSYSCRVNKGTHRAVSRLEKFARKLSKNNQRPIFALKCDVRKFFDSVDQEILLNLIRRRIRDDKAIWLIRKIVHSFPRGLPLGNVTSQLFANIYLNELDQWMKRVCCVKYYIRYCDDFVILGNEREKLENMIPKINMFLSDALKLTLHEKKIIVRKFSQGLDFLGYVIFPHHRLVRTKTRKRIFKKFSAKILAYRKEKIGENTLHQSLQSYLGVMQHANAHTLSEELKNLFLVLTNNLHFGYL